MLYRVQPNGRVTWNEMSRSLFEDIGVEKIELDRLDWQDVEEPIRPADVLAVAVRHGFPTGSGLAVEAHHISALRRPGTLRESYANLKKAAAHPQIKATDEIIEQMAPGWIESGKRNDAAVEESTQQSIREAEDKARAVLDAPVKEELADHWGRLGGIAP